MIETINPATGKKIGSYRLLSEKNISEKSEKGNEAFKKWRAFSFGERKSKMKAAANHLREEQEKLALLMACEMGKPLAQGRSEIEKCAWVCDYFAQESERFLAPEEIHTDASKSYVSFEPLGLVLAIMPWNFPFWQVFRAAAPALMAGNGIVLKHASNVSGCALAIEKIFFKAGFPDAIFQTFLIKTEQVASVIENANIKAVTLTGGTSAGRAVAAKAGECLKKTVLELGGSDPYLILEDADIEQAASTCAASRLINAGQSCIAAKRFIVVKSVQKSFEKMLVRKMMSQKMGDPTDEEVTVGPLARHDLRDGLHELVKESIAKGAKLLCGGKIPDSPGAFYPPTVLTNVKKGMPAYEEETFGPVASIIIVKDDQEAVRTANDSIFGLGAAVFTKDRKHGEQIAQELEAGSCFVNAFVKSDPRLPFGGIKKSGYGRELASFGIREFVNIKTIYIK